ncbi:hypothetical protein ACOZ4F_00495 (plasmid) [Haloarcula marismortui]|uniref:hypothetical protein n=1 Tax=Haloarcula marismortui TaxID=2238 RepID=UPI003C7332CE
MHEDVADATALAVNRVLDEFLATLADDVSKRAFKRLLFGKQTLGDVDLGYKPETYTRFNLVEPLLTAIDLEYQLEPRSTDINRDRWPDIKLTSSAIPYIGEVKALNDIESGREEIKEYLGIDGFIAPYGILTDGAEWLVFGPPDDGGRTSNPVVRKRCSLADALKTVALVEGHWEEDLLSSKIRATGIDQIEAFPRTFHADELDAWALEKMPPAYRAEFLSEHESLQASLDGVWE